MNGNYQQNLQINNFQTPHFDPKNQEKIEEKRAFKNAVSIAAAMTLTYYILANTLPQYFSTIFDFPQFTYISSQLFGDETLLRLIFITLGELLSFLIPVFIMVFVLKQGAPFFALAKTKATNFNLPLILMTFGIIFVTNVLANASNYVLSWFHIVVPDRSFDHPGTIPWIIFMIIYTAIIPAVFEELLFRGAIMGSLRRYGDGVAILVSSILFALAHQHLTAALNAFLVGIILGYFIVRTGSLRAGMYMHFFYNFSIIILTELQRYAQSTILIWNKIAQIFLYLFVPVSMLLAIIGLLMFIKRTKQPFKILDKNNFIPFYEKISIACTNPVMVIVVSLYSFIIVTGILGINL